jgi:hypothetical protein
MSTGVAGVNIYHNDPHVGTHVDGSKCQSEVGLTGRTQGARSGLHTHLCIPRHGDAEQKAQHQRFATEDVFDTHVRTFCIAS